MIFRKRKTDLQRFFDSMTWVKAGRQGYSKQDRYRDFRQTFNTEAGKRVLAQIIDRAEGLPIAENEVSDTHRMAFRAGQRDVALWLIKTLNAEPLEE